MADLEQPLLDHKPMKVYPKCPGCKVAHLVVEGAPPAYRELSFVAIVMLVNALPISFLYPFLYFMVRDMHITKSDKDIGFYVGYIGSAFMIGRFLTAIHWGIMADKYGRKPVLICGVLSVIIFNVIFGFSRSFWAAFLSRFFLGCFNGMMGPVKAYASEICSDEHQPIGISVVGTTLGLGMIVGPAIGGYLSMPGEKYPQMFPTDSLFAQYPYLMPCLFVSGLAAIALFITVFYLPETLHIHTDEDAIIDGETFNEKAKLIGKEELEEEKEKEGMQKAEDSIWAVLKNRPLASAILVYCTWSMHSMAYTEIFSLWAVSPKTHGGLSFSTTDVGNVLAIAGAGTLLFQLLAFSPIAKVLGPIATTRYSAILALPLLCIYPFLSNLSGTLLWILLLFTAVSKNALSVATLSASFLLINNSVFPRQRGRANGLSVSAVSFFKAVGPGAGGALFAWAQRRSSSILPGNQMVFCILGAVVVVDIILTYEPFLPKSVDKPKHDDSDVTSARTA
ncbi:hypothetical protein R1flu_009032 [Riccia fluitans]|uniref:Major facilitator superfamily (MFS) profile domain-containing protein n=1 Tax=Riccia fluitans TaxID=41844 RepID=A0ABD1Z0X5_9MARC